MSYYPYPITLWSRIVWSDAAKVHGMCRNRNCPNTADICVIEVCYECETNPEREIVICKNCNQAECPTWLRDKQLCKSCDLDEMEDLLDPVAEECTVCGGNEHWPKNNKGQCTGCQRYEDL